MLLKCLKGPTGRLTCPFLLPAPGRRLHKDEETFCNETQMVRLFSCFSLSSVLALIMSFTFQWKENLCLSAISEFLAQKTDF